MRPMPSLGCTVIVRRILKPDSRADPQRDRLERRQKGPNVSRERCGTIRFRLRLRADFRPEVTLLGDEPLKPSKPYHMVSNSQGEEGKEVLRCHGKQAIFLTRYLIFDGKKASWQGEDGGANQAPFECEITAPYHYSAPPTSTRLKKIQHSQNQFSTSGSPVIESQ